MNVSSLSFTSALSQYTSGTTRQATAQDGTQQVEGHRHHGGGGGLFQAISSALADIGVTGTSSSSSTSSSSDSSSSDSSSANGTDAAQAMGAFMHTLMQALHAQNGGAQGGDMPPPPPPADDSGSSTSATSGSRSARIESDIKSLLGELNGSSSTSASASTSNDSSSDDVDSQLKDSFATLLKALGVNDTSGNATLTNFLDALSEKFANAPATGNVVNATA